MTDLKTPKLVPRQSDQSLLDAFKIQTLANKIQKKDSAILSSMEIKESSPDTSVNFKTFGEKVELPSESVSLSDSSSARGSPLVVIEENNEDEGQNSPDQVKAVKPLGLKAPVFEKLQINTLESLRASSDGEEKSFVSFDDGISGGSSPLENEMETGVKVQTKLNLKAQYEEHLKDLRKYVLHPNEDTVQTLLQNY